MFRKIKLFFLVISLFPLLEGCSSFGKGVAQAFIEDAEKKDNRSCQIWTDGFTGINASIGKREGKTKVLMVHGVGHHIPGYSTILLENLAKALDLPVKSTYKELTLSDIDGSSKELGILRVTRLQSKDRSRELLFYELTWSSITEPLKKILAYDTSGEHSFRRAHFNDLMKKFSNDAISDPMIYLGEEQKDIQYSVAESYCWMISHGWSDFPDGIHKPCDLTSPELIINAEKDDYIFISHSLGSRITIDAMQYISKILNDKDFLKKYKGFDKLHHTLQNRDVTIFMLSNQLPLLQLGRSLPEVTNEHEKYCSPQGSGYADRIANQTHIVAFSDPNDILSYTLPQGFKEEYLDSRMCTKISNISINVAYVVDILGFSDIANPLEAHVGYDNDERVVALLAHGLNDQNISPLIKKRCEWVEHSH